MLRCWLEQNSSGCTLRPLDRTVWTQSNFTPSSLRIKMICLKEEQANQKEEEISQNVSFQSVLYVVFLLHKDTGWGVFVCACGCARGCVCVCVYWPVTSSTLGLISRSGPTSKALWVRRWTSKTQREYNYLIYGHIDQSAITFLPLTGDIKITKQWVICTLKV